MNAYGCPGLPISGYRPFWRVCRDASMHGVDMQAVRKAVVREYCRDLRSALEETDTVST